MSRKPHIALLSLALGLTLALHAGVASGDAKTYKVHNIDVGQGAATLIQTLGGKNILVDTGWDFAGDRLVAYLRKIKVKKIDAIVITHRHMDHIGGVQKVAEAFPVSKIIGPWKAKGIPISAMSHLAHLRKDLRKAKGPTNRPIYENAAMGKIFDFGKGFTMETLWPKVPTSGKRIGDFNEESVTLHITQKSPNGQAATFLVGGDLGVKEERWLARNKPEKLRSDWIVADHHGSAGSSQREYMVAVNSGYSPMLKALIDGDTSSPIGKLASKLKIMGRGKLAGLLMREVDPLNKKPKKITGGWLKKAIADIRKMTKNTPNREGRFAVYSVGPNAYGHPNATRMSEALLAGFTPITTWANGTVVMTREVSRNGKWSGNWTPKGVSSRNLPKAKTPAWLGKTDPDKPYNGVRREANYQWSLQNPQREVAWTAKWDTTKSWRTVSRETSKGRKAWVEKYVQVKSDAKKGTKDGVEPKNEAERKANKRSAKAKFKRMQYTGKTAWHGLKIDNMRELTREQLHRVAQRASGHLSGFGAGLTVDPVAGAHLGNGTKTKKLRKRRTRSAVRHVTGTQQQRRVQTRTRTRTRSTYRPRRATTHR